jgi:hypothetical protein
MSGKRKYELYSLTYCIHAQQTPTIHAAIVHIIATNRTTWTSNFQTIHSKVCSQLTNRVGHATSQGVSFQSHHFYKEQRQRKMDHETHEHTDAHITHQALDAWANATIAIAERTEGQPERVIAWN